MGEFIHLFSVGDEYILSHLCFVNNYFAGIWVLSADLYFLQVLEFWSDGLLEVLMRSMAAVSLALGLST